MKINTSRECSKPVEHFQTSYYAVVDASLCKGCKKCVEKCGMNAITVKEKLAVIDLYRCLGCGVCIASCTNKANALKKKEKKHVPPRTHDSMYQKIMMERFGILHSLKAVSKILVGKKA